MKGPPRPKKISTKKLFQVSALALLLSYFCIVHKTFQRTIFLEDKANLPNVKATIAEAFLEKDNRRNSRQNTSLTAPASKVPPPPTTSQTTTQSHARHVNAPKHSRGNTTLSPKFKPKVYKSGNWDLAPIVVEKYKLLFFTQGKVACTEFKKLLRRMMHLKDWRLHNEPKIPHDPRYNGLKYLYYYPLPKALDMLTDPTWTRAIFVRDPKERLLSAYLDKAAKKNGLYVDRHCCPKQLQDADSCGKRASRSLLDFVHVIRKECCCDAHWKPQSQRIDEELWDQVNFVGYFESLAEDARKMLGRLGVWEEFGASGWGKYQNESIFTESSQAKHRTGAGTKLSKYFNDSVVEDLVFDFYSGDYKRFAYEPNKLVGKVK